MNTKVKTLIDWFAFTVHWLENPLAVISDVLGMDTNLFSLQRGGLNGYQQMYVYENIKVSFDAYKVEQFGDMGVYVCMSGSGCRTFENYSSYADGAEHSAAFLRLFEVLAAHRELVNITRIDLACDDRTELLDMQVIAEAKDPDYHGTMVRSKLRLGGINKSWDGLQSTGVTVYIGSRKSDFFVRFYDKAREQEVKKRMEYGALGHWVRCELVFKKSYAKALFDLLCNTEHLGAMMASVLNDKLSFVENDDTNISRCTVCKWWSDFVSSIERVHMITREAAAPALDRTNEWVRWQVGPSLVVLKKSYGLGYFLKLLDEAEERLSSKHKALIEQCNKSRE